MLNEKSQILDITQIYYVFIINFAIIDEQRSVTFRIYYCIILLILEFKE